MIEREISELSTRWQVNLNSLSKERPLCFKWNDFDYCLELQDDNNEFLILSLSFKVDSYDHQTLPKFLEACSVFKRALIEFSVGFVKDKIILLTQLSQEATAFDIENAVLKLQKVHEEVLKGD